ncbi:MAG TPA: class I SAM-dependent methyltransferase [Gemmatimonadaceae bacterium]|nr:class I SAM-dependent methyltransferase [Gemmatimonadaceae bacterium]
METTFNRLVRAIEKRYSSLLAHGQFEAFALQLVGGPTAVFGRGDPAVTLVVKDRRGLLALRTLDALAVGEAYLAGFLDIRGDLARLLALRDLFADRHPLRFVYRFLRPFLFGQVASDRAWIASHYDSEPEFYSRFLDARHRCYSHGVFATDDEPLEDAITRKLDFALEATRLEPGQRVLDIGGGWGAFPEYAGKRGIRVTTLTISESSERFIADLIARDGLPCAVLRQHFFDHRPEQPYHAIVNMGVTEHLPDYRRTLQRYEELLVPGGRVYLDASACRRKHDVSTFFERYIFPGNGSPLCLHDYLLEVSRTKLEVEAVHNDRRNYLLTTRRWAENLDAHRAEVEERWGTAQYRRFQIYLWGCVDGFTRDIIQAYRLVLRKNPGQRSASDA